MFAEGESVEHGQVTERIHGWLCAVRKAFFFWLAGDSMKIRGEEGEVESAAGEAAHDHNYLTTSDAATSASVGYELDKQCL